MQTVSLADNLHEVSNPTFKEKKRRKNSSKCRLLTFLPSMQSFKELGKTVAENILILFFLLFFGENKTWHFMWIIHAKSYFLLKISKKKKKN